MPLNYTWYNQTFGAHPSTRADFEKYFDSSGRYPQVTFGGGGIYTGPLNFGGGMPNALPSFLPASNMSFKVEGYIYIPVAGEYSFRSNGDDAIDIIIDGQVIAYWYGSHGIDAGTAPTSWIGTVTLTQGYHHFISRFESVGGGLAMEVSWKKPGDTGFYTIPNTQFINEYVSNIHKDTPLPIKTCISADSNTTFLAHYDVTEEESLFGIKPLGTPVASLRRIEGMYGGGIAVEEGTDNLIKGGDMATQALPQNAGESYTTGNVSIIESPVPNPINSPYVIRFDNVDGAISELLIRPKAGAVYGPGKYTLSCYVWVSDDWDGQAQLMHNRWWDATGIITENSGMVFPKSRNQWERITFTMDMGDRTPTTFNWYFSYPNKSSKGFIYITGIQVENKAFATSHVEGTRANGNLAYPINVLNRLEGTISLWAASINDIAPLPSGTSVGFGDRAFVTTGNWNAEGDGFLLYLNDGDQLYLLHSSYSCGGADGLTWKANEWHMITMTWSLSETKARIYLDGKYISSCSISPTYTIAGFNVGWANSNFIFDELRIDKVKRTDDEIEQWYLSQSPFFPKGVHRVYA